MSDRVQQARERAEMRSALIAALNGKMPHPSTSWQILREWDSAAERADRVAALETALRNVLYAEMEYQQAYVLVPKADIEAARAALAGSGTDSAPAEGSDRVGGGPR